MNLDFNKFTRFDYWFEGVIGKSADIPTVDISSVYYNYYIYTFIFLVALGVLLTGSRLFLHNQNPLISKFSNWGTQFSWIGVLGISWFTLRQTKVALFGGRFWAIIGLVWLLILLYFIAKYFVFNFKLEYNFYKSQKEKK
jgi:hypothetical protein